MKIPREKLLSLPVVLVERTGNEGRLEKRAAIVIEVRGEKGRRVSLALAVFGIGSFEPMVRRADPVSWGDELAPEELAASRWWVELAPYMSDEQPAPSSPVQLNLAPEVIPPAPPPVVDVLSGALNDELELERLTRPAAPSPAPLPSDELNEQLNAQREGVRHE